MNVLGIETSCDETSAAIVSDGKILSNIVSSQTTLHAKFGGIVPEIASRRHVELICLVVEEALEAAGLAFSDLDGVAVTNRPGLVGALLVGVSAAKAIAATQEIPLVGIHHLEGHIYSTLIVNPEFAFPFVSLVVSGGHTDLLIVKGHGEYEMLGRTRDDAAGEAFDKCARIMGLGYPGGPIIDELASKGNAQAIRFPRARLDNSLDFSFSGLKTAVLRFVRDSGEGYRVEDLAASFQAAVVDMLAETTMAAVERTNIRRVALGGGVAANKGLQRRMMEEAERREIELSCPPARLCTDNAAMIACAGYHRLIRGITDNLNLDTLANEPLA